GAPLILNLLPYTTLFRSTLPVTKKFFRLPTSNFQLSHVWHLFVIRHPQRDKLQKYLTKNGIQTLIHYPIPPHKQLAYKEMNNLRSEEHTSELQSRENLVC